LITSTTMTVSAEATALLSHVVSQMQQNVEFLVSQKYISAADASAIVARLPAVVDGGTDAAPYPMPQPERRVVPHPPAPRRPVAQARALWAYNENGQEPDELSFAAGDIIEIITETNNDWGMGKVHGKQALFPANYVEKISQPGSLQTDEHWKSGKTFATPQAPPYTPLVVQPAPEQEEKKKGFGKYKSTIAHSAAGGVGFGAGAAIGGGLLKAIF